MVVEVPEEVVEAGAGGEGVVEGRRRWWRPGPKKRAVTAG